MKNIGIYISWSYVGILSPEMRKLCQQNKDGFGLDKRMVVRGVEVGVEIED